MVPEYMYIENLNQI